MARPLLNTITIGEMMNSSDLKKLRISLGLTITAMAARLNTPRGTYVKWERGERRVPGILNIAIKSI